jgi:hypothetical protein
MANRYYGQGGRDQYDRDEENFDREYREDRWERGRQRAESGSASEYNRAREDDWNERMYRGGSRAPHEDTGREEWERDRPRRSDQNRYERGAFFGSGGGRGEMSSGRQYERDWSEGGGGPRGGRDTSYSRGTSGGSYRERDWSESSFGPGTVEGMSGFGPGVGPRASGQRRFESNRGYYGEYGGYGVAPTDYGPSTGYGYGPAQSYIGDQGQSSRSLSQSHQRNFAGRGPRNYKRSDERIREDLNERLTRHPDLDATDIDVRVTNCQVILMGVVEDRRAKRLAEDIAEDVWGVDDVRNELKVRHGFLASLTGEKADDRDVTQPAIREGDEAARKAGRTPGSTSGSTVQPGSTGT